ncbi:MAG TPA: hypothetical protein VI653_25025 [Steroidobacteraceae bacterium]
MMTERRTGLDWRAQVWEFALFIGVVAAALFSISEIGARETMSNFLSSELTAALKEASTRSAAAEVLKAKVEAQRYHRSDRGALTPLEQSTVNGQRTAALLANIADRRSSTLTRAQQYLTSVSALGIAANSDPMQSLSVGVMMQKLNADLAGLDNEEEDTRFSASGTRTHSDASLAKRAPIVSLATVAPHSPNVFERLKTENLLAITIICCATLGGMLALVRRQEAPTLRTLTLGAATGFVVFLIIKGGRYVFFTHLQSDQINFNAYGAAFTGFIAGLFSDMAFGVLHALVRDLSERIQGAVSNSGPSRAVEQPGSQNPNGVTDELAAKRSQAAGGAR